MIIKEHSNLNKEEIELDIRDLFAVTFQLYDMAEGYRIVYKKDPKSRIPKTLIKLYLSKIKPNYQEMIYNFKKKYVANELLVEKNDTVVQRKGLISVYDYIQNFDINTQNFDIFTCTLTINNLLWKFRDEKFVEDTKNREAEIEKLFQDAKKERNLAKYREAESLRRNLQATNSKNKIGGRFRTDDEEVRLFDVDIQIPSPNEAVLFMNNFLKPDQKERFNKYLHGEDVFEYIKYCIRTTAEMMRNQPFLDGNKRTFRSLLNLMFKMRNLPPVYIKTSERKIYKDALYKAMKEKKYEELYGFYYFKICDSIYELDIVPYLDKKEKQRNEQFKM